MGESSSSQGICIKKSVEWESVWLRNVMDLLFKTFTTRPAKRMYVSRRAELQSQTSDRRWNYNYWYWLLNAAGLWLTNVKFSHYSWFNFTHSFSTLNYLCRKIIFVLEYDWTLAIMTFSTTSVSIGHIGHKRVLLEMEIDNARTYWNTLTLKPEVETSHRFIARLAAY